MSDSDPDQYSLDEMMNRLRQRGKASADEDAQLVTRADGSRMMKVRKRKRRSSQPHKVAEAKRRKRSLLFAGLATLILMLIGLGVVAWFIKINSKGYRTKLADRVSLWTGAEVAFRQFRATPVSLGADQVEFTWPEDAPAARLTLNGVQGDLRLASHLGSDMVGQQLMARNPSELILRAVPSTTPTPSDLPDEPCPFQFSYRAQNLTVKFGDGPRAAFQLTGTSASFLVPDALRRSGNLVLQGGSARIPGWGTFILEFGSVTLNATGLTVGSIEMSPEGHADAEIRLRGEKLPPVQTRGGESELRLRLTDMPSMALLGDGLGNVVDAVFETPESESDVGRLFFDVTDPESLRVEAPVQVTLSSTLTLQKLEMFHTLARVTGSERLAQGRFETEAKAQLRKTRQETRLERLQLVSQGLIKIEGTLAEKRGGTLEGFLDVGLPDSTVFGASSRALPAVFNRRSGGYQWARVKVSGKATAPVDDLADQLENAMRVTSPADSGGTGLEDEFMDLTTPGGGR